MVEEFVNLIPLSPFIIPFVSLVKVFITELPSTFTPFEPLILPLLVKFSIVPLPTNTPIPLLLIVPVLFKVCITLLLLLLP